MAKFTHTVLLKIFLIFMFAYPVVNCQSCSFNSNCTCFKEPLYIICNWDIPTFPVFDVFNSTPIAQISININYTGPETLTIPPNAFVNLQSLQQSANILIIGLYSDCSLSPKLVISQNSLNTYQNILINQVQFGVLYIPSIAAETFNNINIFILQFLECCIDAIDDYAFSGLSVNGFYLQHNRNDDIQVAQWALSNANFTNTGRSVLDWDNSLIKDVKAYKYASVTSLVLSHNQIATVDNFAFCACNSLSVCNNTILNSVDLSYNNIESITEFNAFANLPNLNTINLQNNNIELLANYFLSNLPQLIDINLDNNKLTELGPLTDTLIENSNLQLSVANNQLTSVPIDALQSVANALNIVDLSNNKIASISANSFYKLPKLAKIYLHGNPITAIAPGAFNTLTMTSLILSRLDQLISLDLLIAYGMPNLKLVFIEDVALQTVTLSDSTKLPPSLETIKISMVNTLIQIDSALAAWLTIRSTNVYDFSDNKNFPCDDNIQWMAQFSVCNPVQIKVNSTTCQDGSSLFDYLQSFKPSCK